MRAWLSLGSNVDRTYNIRSAVHMLRRRFGRLILSRVYESAAVGFEGEPFYNMVVGIQTEISPPVLVQELRGMETAHGRFRGDDKFAPRTLDIDLLTFGDLVERKEGKIVLPRDEITRYAFVLRPLAEVAGDERHPLLGRTYSQLWSEFEGETQLLQPVPLALEAES